MRFRDFPAWVRDTTLRLFPHQTQPGLRAIGKPDAAAPIVVTGNFTLTVRRMIETLEGRDVWLLVADSQGINVWCAAGGGHLTHHEVIAAVRACALSSRVSHRMLILPQLAATGVEPHKITATTGFETRWGPARLEDLPAYLDRGYRTVKRDRYMRFPLWERMEMAVMWAAPMTPILMLLVWLLIDLRTALVCGTIAVVMVFGLLAAVPYVPIVGAKRFVTFVALTIFGAVVGSAAFFALGSPTVVELLGVAISAGVVTLVLSVDLTGSTPWFPSYINSFKNRFDVELVEDRCTGSARCVLVCPKNVFEMDGRRRKVRIARPDDCLRCGACVVQCPEDALQFRFADDRIVPPSVVRTTRMNMLGRRSISVETGKDS